jgi:hypothetical protein
MSAMSAPRRLAPPVLVSVFCVLVATRVARAQDVGTAADPGGIDDPKVERRLGTRIDLPPAPAGESPPPTSGVAPAAVAEATPRPVSEEKRTPRLQIAYRRFTFNQIAQTASAAPAADEPFNVVSLDFYPVSSAWRFGLSTQYGWEQGTFRANGDAFIAESLSLGGQIAGPVATPFFEVHAGGGLMQRTHTGLGLNTIASAYGQLGVDVGVDFFVARHAFFSGALGYLHGTNGFVKDNAFGSFSVDTWAFKLGFGL